MPLDEDIDYTDRRTSLPSRRHEDVELFAACPKYFRHDLSQEQVDAIAEKAAIRAMQLYQAENDREFVKVTKKGFIWLLGGVVSAAYLWALSHGLIEVEK